MPQFSSRKVITHYSQIENAQGYAGIGYDMIIYHYLMIQLGPKDEFGRQIIEWDDAVIPMKEPDNFLGKHDLTKRDMQKVVMQTAQPASTGEATQKFVKIVGSTYAKYDSDKVSAAAFQLDTKLMQMLLSLLK